MLNHIQLVKGKEKFQIFFGGHRFRFYKMVFRQVHRFIFHKIRRGGQCGHQAEQPVLHGKLSDSGLDFRIRFPCHSHAPNVDGVQHDLPVFRQRIVDARLRCFCGCKIQSPVLCRFPFIFTVPHPLGTGAFKKVRHTLNPPLYIVTQITQIYIIYYTASLFRYQPSVRTLLKILFPARSSAAAFPPCPSGRQAAFFVSF